MHGYQERNEALPTVRGRIDFTRQLRLRQGCPYPIDCRYEEYCEDTELNRVIRAAHRRLLPTPSLPADLARRLHRTISFFSGVTDVSYPQGAVPVLRFDRMTRHWEPPGRLAELILQQQTIRDQAGRIVGSTFTVDMNKLFERFITTVVEREARRKGWTVRAQAKRNLTRELVMQPDLVLMIDGRDHAVGDAKYKELSSGELLHPDMYQLLAYIVALGLRRGLLIYAQEQPLREQFVQRAGVTLEIVGVNLQRRPNQILASAEAAARRLIHHADDDRRRAASGRAA